MKQKQQINGLRSGKIAFMQRAFCANAILLDSKKSGRNSFELRPAITLYVVSSNHRSSSGVPDTPDFLLRWRGEPAFCRSQGIGHTPLWRRRCSGRHHRYKSRQPWSFLRFTPHALSMQGFAEVSVQSPAAPWLLYRTRFGPVHAVHTGFAWFRMLCAPLRLMLLFGRM